eukprot:2510255-Alexandrium_andersonii.AAC.1
MEAGALEAGQDRCRGVPLRRNKPSAPRRSAVLKCSAPPLPPEGRARRDPWGVAPDPCPVGDQLAQWAAFRFVPWAPRECPPCTYVPERWSGTPSTTKSTGDWRWAPIAPARWTPPEGSTCVRARALPP